MSQTKHAFLYWVQKTPKKKQALLVEPITNQRNTLEHFFFYEMDYKSKLLERFLVHGGKFKAGAGFKKGD